MAFDFFPTIAHPAAPIVGDVSNGYTWDGEKWTMTPPAVGAVRYDTAQALTSDTLPATMGQRAQARSNIFAAPFDALSYSGMQINGSMDVSQANGATTLGLVNNQATFLVDNWMGYYNSATAVMGAAQYSPSGLAGFPNCLFLRSSTGAPFSGATEAAILYSAIEGYRVARLGWGAAGAQPVTIGFWVQGTVAGTMAVAVNNGGNNRSYVVDVAINGGSVWQYKTVTIPGDVTGTWGATNGVGLSLKFCFASGLNQQVAAGAWISGYYFATPATTNFFAATNNQVVITGVVVLPGIEAPSAARSPLIMRPFDQELVMCQRYWEKTYPYADPPGKAYGNPGGGTPLSSFVVYTTQYVFLPWFFRKKRSAATITVYSPYTGASGMMRVQNMAADLAAFANPSENFTLILSNTTVVNQVDAITAHAVADARL